MKLYNTPLAPNPRRVRFFLAEKGVTVPTENVDLIARRNRGPDYLAVNPLGHVPALLLDDGTVITESIAICRYFERTNPDPPLFGRGAVDEAQVEMWNRRAELYLMAPIAAVFRHLHPAMKEMEKPQVPAWAEANRPRVTDFLAFLDKELATRPFIAGERFTVADITALVAVDFMKPARLQIPAELEHVRRWRERVSARSAAVA